MLQHIPQNTQTSALPVSLRLPVRKERSTSGALTLEPRRSLAAQGTLRKGNIRIVEGCIALHQSLADGRRQILDILGPGRLLGTELMGSLSCSAEPMTETRVELLPEAPETDADLQTALMLMLHRAQAHATLLGRKTATEKVASALLDLAGQFASLRGRTRTFRLYLTRADIADWLGLTLETVSRTLNGFKRGHVIDFRHADIITIRDQAALCALAAGEMPQTARRQSGSRTKDFPERT